MSDDLAGESVQWEENQVFKPQEKQKMSQMARIERARNWQDLHQVRDGIYCLTLVALPLKDTFPQLGTRQIINIKYIIS